MNYNDYDSNGNKKKFNLSDMFFNKQKRSILVLGMYILGIAVLIIFLRLSFKNTFVQKDKEDNKEEVKEEIKDDKKDEIKEKDEIDKLFSFIDSNNYNFRFTINDSGVNYVSEGKRYNDNYSFTFTDGNQLISFLGTKDNIKVKTVDGNIMVSSFPYVFFNYYDSEIIKNVIRKSSNNNDIYEISNEKLFEIIGRKANEDSKDALNTVELIVKNNNVVGLKIDITNAISSIEKQEKATIITLDYYDFGLVEDFDISAFD